MSNYKYLVSFWTRGNYRQGFVEADNLKNAKIKAGRKFGADVTEVSLYEDLRESRKFREQEIPDFMYIGD